MQAETIAAYGVALIVLGFILVFSATILSAGGGKTTMRGGGVVFLGPIPLVFGSDKKSALAISLVALALMIFYFVFSRR